MRHSEVSNLANTKILECVNEQKRCCWFLIRAHLTIDMTVYQAYNFQLIKQCLLSRASRFCTDTQDWTLKPPWAETDHYKQHARWFQTYPQDNYLSLSPYVYFLHILWNLEHSASVETIQKAEPRGIHHVGWCRPTTHWLCHGGQVAVLQLLVWTLATLYCNYPRTGLFP